MDSVINDLASLSRDVNSKDDENYVARLIFIFAKDLHITPTEFMELEIPLIFELLDEYEKFNKEQERQIKKRR